MKSLTISAVRSASGRERLGRDGRMAFLLRVGVLHAAVEAVSAEQDGEPVLLARLDDDLDVADPGDGLGEQGAQLAALLGGGAAGAAVRDEALVERGEVRPGGHVARGHRKAHAERLEHAAADFVLQRVVAEQRQVRRPAARRDAAADRVGQPAFRLAGELVQAGDVRRLQFGPALVRHAAEAVGDQQHDLGGILLGEFAQNFIWDHGHLLEASCSTVSRSPAWLRPRTRTRTRSRRPCGRSATSPQGSIARIVLRSRPGSVSPAG